MLTFEELQTIHRANEAQRQIENLQQMIDDELLPICLKIMKKGSLEEMGYLMEMLPQGFYKTELRVLLSTKK